MRGRGSLSRGVRHFKPVKRRRLMPPGYMESLTVWRANSRPYRVLGRVAGVLKARVDYIRADKLYLDGSATHAIRVRRTEDRYHPVFRSQELRTPRCAWARIAALYSRCSSDGRTQLCAPQSRSGRSLLRSMASPDERYRHSRSSQPDEGASAAPVRRIRLPLELRCALRGRAVPRNRDGAPIYQRFNRFRPAFPA